MAYLDNTWLDFNCAFEFNDIVVTKPLTNEVTQKLHTICKELVEWEFEEFATRRLITAELTGVRFLLFPRVVFSVSDMMALDYTCDSSLERFVEICESIAEEMEQKFREVLNEFNSTEN